MLPACCENYDSIVARSLTLSATGLAELNRRTRDRAIAAKDATISRSWLQTCATGGTVVEKDARIGRHCFFDLLTAMRAGDNRQQLRFAGSMGAADEIIPNACGEQPNEPPIQSNKLE